MLPAVGSVIVYNATCGLFVAATCPATASIGSAGSLLPSAHPASTPKHPIATDRSIPRFMAFPDVKT